MSHSHPSLVDDFILHTSDYSKVLNLNVTDSYFSDHCLIKMLLAFNFHIQSQTTNTFDKFSWDSSKGELLIRKLEENRSLFDEISNLICCNTEQIDEQIVKFMDLAYDICFAVYGKMVSTYMYL